jgi:hypothetical protein
MNNNGYTYLACPPSGNIEMQGAERAGIETLKRLARAHEEQCGGYVRAWLSIYGF